MYVFPTTSSIPTFETMYILPLPSIYILQSVIYVHEIKSPFNENLFKSFL